MGESLNMPKMLRLPEVLSIMRVKKSSWWKGVQEGRYPPGHKLGPRLRVWAASEIEDLVQKILSDEQPRYGKPRMVKGNEL